MSAEAISQHDFNAAKISEAFARPEFNEAIRRAVTQRLDAEFEAFVADALMGALQPFLPLLEREYGLTFLVEPGDTDGGDPLADETPETETEEP